MKKSPSNNLSVSSNISHALGHDLKQPLSLIRAYSYYLEKKISTSQSDLLPYTEKINLQVDVLTTMLNNIVESIKFENKQVIYKTEKINLGELLQEVIKKLEKQYTSIKIKSTINTATIKITGDRAYIEMALTNIIENAFRFSDTTTPVTITSSTKQDCLVITVTNTGLSIAKAEQAFIFDAFYKAKNSSTTSNKGLGLGLFISKKIIEQHGGAIQLSSSKESTQITITLKYDLHS